MIEPRNPFLANLRIEFVPRQKTSVLFGRNESGKKTTDYFFAERAEKTSVYKTPEFFALIPTLKPSTKDLLLYIIMSLGWGSDRIQLDREKLAVWGLKTQSFYNARGELVDCGVICHYQKNVYWINPAYFFKGDRFKYASENGVSAIKYKPKNFEQP